LLTSAWRIYSLHVNTPPSASHTPAQPPAAPNLEGLAAEVESLRASLDSLRTNVKALTPETLAPKQKAGAVAGVAGVVVVTLAFALAWVSVSGQRSTAALAGISGLVLVATAMQLYEVLKQAWEKPGPTVTRESVFFAVLWFAVLGAAAVAFVDALI
jgi:hypothetical protein